jgi:type 1 glutamine amidotransferase
MGNMNKSLSITAGAALALSLSAAAAPVRVLIFNPCGPGGYIHPISQITPQIKKMLLNPAGANLQNPLIPPDGFTVDSLGSATQNGTTTDGHNLILALPKTDVIICNNNTSFTGLFTPTDQKAFLEWAQAKGTGAIPGHGVVAFHGATDDNGNWPEKITFFGGKFTNHTTAPAGVLADSTPSTVADPHFQALSAGIAKSITVTDEWYSYQSAPRSIPGIKILSTLNEATYSPASRMGDHPISWYRAPENGGRMYYTGAGHDWVYFRDTYWLRRQLYNGILWASGWSPISTAKFIDTKAPGARNNLSQIQGTSLVVAVDREGAHTVEIRGLDGKRVAMERGTGKLSHTFANLKPNAVYAVVVNTPREKSRQLIKTR